MTEKETSVTLKGGKGFEEPWIVVRGTPAECREQLVEIFGYDKSQAPQLSLSSLVRNASADFHSLGPVAQVLGGRVVSEEPGGDWPQTEVPAEPSKPAEPESPVIAAINAATTKQELQQLFVKFQTAFADPAVQEAAKARRAAIGA